MAFRQTKQSLKLRNHNQTNVTERKRERERDGEEGTLTYMIGALAEPVTRENWMRIFESERRRRMEAQREPDRLLDFQF